MVRVSAPLKPGPTATITSGRELGRAGPISTSLGEAGPTFGAMKSRGDCAWRIAWSFAHRSPSSR